LWGAAASRRETYEKGDSSRLPCGFHVGWRFVVCCAHFRAREIGAIRITALPDHGLLRPACLDVVETWKVATESVGRSSGSADSSVGATLATIGGDAKAAEYD